MTEPSKEIEPVHVTPIPIATMEGETVRFMVGKFPALTLQMDMGYPRGTYLKIEMLARVRKLSLDEIERGPDKGQTVREHTFAIVESRIVGAYTEQQMDEMDGSGVGGSAAADAPQQEEDEDEHGAEPAGGGPEGRPTRDDVPTGPGPFDVDF